MSTLRNELKFYISSAAARILEGRLRAVLPMDSHTAAFGAYQIRSLYFDDPSSSAFYDKVNGIEKRAKYRIRFYNRSLDFIRLEKKEKIGNKSMKSGDVITVEQSQSLFQSPSELCETASLLSEMQHKCQHEHYRPMIFVDYTRKAFLHPAGNVRITLDSDLFSSLFRGDLMDDTGRVPVLGTNETILEVKYDSFLPPYIASMLLDIPKVQCAISKFCKCHEILF